MFLLDPKLCLSLLFLLISGLLNYITVVPISDCIGLLKNSIRELLVRICVGKRRKQRDSKSYTISEYHTKANTNSKLRLRLLTVDTYLFRIYQSRPSG